MQLPVPLSVNEGSTVGCGGMPRDQASRGTGKPGGVATPFSGASSQVSARPQAQLDGGSSPSVTQAVEAPFDPSGSEALRCVGCQVTRASRGTGALVRVVTQTRREGQSKGPSP